MMMGEEIDSMDEALEGAVTGPLAHDAATVAKSRIGRQYIMRVDGTIRRWIEHRRP